MGFAVTVPIANQTPGAFPAQSNTNFQRLFDVINAEHVFSTVTSTDQGTHKKVSFTDLTLAPTIPTGTSGTLYSALDTSGSGQSELFWKNAVRIQKITAQEYFLPQRITGTATFSNLQSQTIFANPGYDYTGTLTIYINNTNEQSFYCIMKSGVGSDRGLLDSSGSSPPTITYGGSGNLDIIAKNQFNLTENIVWSLIINRI